MRFGQHVAVAVRHGVEEDAMRPAVERLDLDVGTVGRRAVDLLDVAMGEWKLVPEAGIRVGRYCHGLADHSL